MITIYRPPRGGKYVGIDSSSSEDEVIPAGLPYVTKVNGKLVMARDKMPARQPSTAMSLLGEAFGVESKVIHKRSKSVDGYHAPPLMIGGIPYVPQLQQVTYTSPLPQQPFQTGLLPGTPIAPIAPIAPCQHPYTTYPGPIYRQETMLPRRYTVPAQDPTPEDFDLLQQIDADYNSKKKGKGKSRVNSAPDLTGSHVSGATKTTITAERHVCGNCGRLRSRKYHMDHPIKKGQEPPVAFCRKCQRDASSTEGSDISKNKNKTGSKKGKGKDKEKQPKTTMDLTEEDSPKQTSAQRKKKAQVEQTQSSILSSSRISLLFKKNKKKGNNPDPSIIYVEEEDEDIEEIPMPKPKPKPRRKTSTRHEIYPAHSYIVEEDYYSDDDRRPKERLRLRYGHSEAGRRPSSPQTEYRSSRPRRREDERDDPRKVDEEPRRSRESIVERSRSPHYRYVQPFAEPENVEPVPELRGRRSRLIPEEDFIPSRRTYDQGPARNMGNRDDSFGSNDSARSHSSTRRRRQQERNHPRDEFAQPWDVQHDIHPQPGTEKVVVTERYVYRRKRDSNDRGERGRSVDGDRSRHSRRTRTDLSADDHAYYHNDWRAEEHRTRRDESTPGPSRRRGYRRDTVQDPELYSEVAASENLHYDQAYTALHENLPRAPTPPSPLLSPSPSFQEHAPRHRTSKGKGPTRSPSPVRRTRGRSTSNHRPPFVREATEGGTEKALIPSPKGGRSFEEPVDPFYSDIVVVEEYNDGDDVSEKERAVEGGDGRGRAAGRKVKFREEDSLVEVSEFGGSVGTREESAERSVKWGGGGGEAWGGGVETAGAGGAKW